VVSIEKIPLPDNCRLGLEERGVYLNNSGKVNTNFRVRREQLFCVGRVGNKRGGIGSQLSQSQGGGLRAEMRVERYLIKVRNGTPVVLVVGDEAVLMVMGHTGVGSKEATCAWVLKKEHLALGYADKDQSGEKSS
jgi:hypothetical protein